MRSHDLIRLLDEPGPGCSIWEALENNFFGIILRNMPGWDFAGKTCA